MLRLIYFSPVAFGSYEQRPHFLVRHLLDVGAVSEVLWVEPYPTRLPRWHDLVRPPTLATPPAEPAARLQRLVVPALPIEPLPGGWAINRSTVSRSALRELTTFQQAAPCAIGVGRPSALAIWAIESLPHRVSFFDAMDDFPAFYGRLSGRAMLKREESVARGVDWVFCSSHQLVRKLSPVAKRVRLVPNGYPMAELPAAAPAEARTAVGYIGTMAGWFDWGLVIEIAQALSPVPVRLIGPQFHGRPRTLPPNIELFPECTRQDAARYVREFAIGLIPFHLSRLTASVDPIKYYEYKAFGVPVWSTPFGEMAVRGRTPGVRLVGQGTDWCRLYEETRQEPMDEEQIARFRRENDWAARFAVVADCLTV